MGGPFPGPWGGGPSRRVWLSMDEIFLAHRLVSWVPALCPHVSPSVFSGCLLCLPPLPALPALIHPSRGCQETWEPSGRRQDTGFPPLPPALCGSPRGSGAQPCPLGGNVDASPGASSVSLHLQGLRIYLSPRHYFCFVCMCVWHIVCGQQMPSGCVFQAFKTVSSLMLSRFSRFRFLC